MLVYVIFCNRQHEREQIKQTVSVWWIMGRRSTPSRIYSIVLVGHLLIGRNYHSCDKMIENKVKYIGLWRSLPLYLIIMIMRCCSTNLLADFR